MGFFDLRSILTGSYFSYWLAFTVVLLTVSGSSNPASAGHFVQSTTSVEVEGKLTLDQEYSNKVSPGWVPVSGTSQEIAYEDKTLAIGGKTTLEKDFKASGDREGDLMSLATFKSLSFQPIKTTGKFVPAQLDFQDMELPYGRWVEIWSSLVERWLEVMGEMKAKAEAAAAASITKANAAANLAVSRQPPMSSSQPSLGVNAQTFSGKDQVTTQGSARVNGSLEAAGTPKSGSSNLDN